jgi:carbonic anhydrase
MEGRVMRETLSLSRATRRCSSAVAALALAATVFVPARVARADSAASSVAPAEALARLKAGNERFVQGNFAEKDLTDAKRLELTRGQAPFATILTCSDSRVPPELIFDQFQGDVFIARVAGNVADPIVLGSLEYAQSVLGSSLLVVMGHDRCGAVDAAQKGKDLGPNIGAIVAQIKPSLTPDATLDQAIQENVRGVMKSIPERSAVLKAALDAGKIKIVGAVFDIGSGKVTWLE